MKEITDTALAELRASLSVCNPWEYTVEDLMRMVEEAKGWWPFPR